MDGRLIGRSLLEDYSASPIIGTQDSPPFPGPFLQQRRPNLAYVVGRAVLRELFPMWEPHVIMESHKDLWLQRCLLELIGTSSGSGGEFVVSPAL